MRQNNIFSFWQKIFHLVANPDVRNCGKASQLQIFYLLKY